jgi:hypothetical protein
VTFWHRWREMRARFLVLAALTLFASGMIAARSTGHVAAQLAARDAAGRVELRRHRVSAEWFGNKGPSVLVMLGAVFLVVGGPMTEPGRGSTLFAAALPTTRRRLFGIQLGVAVSLVAALAALGVVGSLAGAAAVGAPYPLVPALAGALVQGVGVLPFAGLLLALQAATRRAITSTITLLGVSLVVPPLAADFAPPGALRDLFDRLEFPPMIPWEPRPELHTLSGAALFGALPWGALAAALAIAAVASAVALALFERREL